MCGLVGCMGYLTAQHEKAFKELLIINTLRGTHGAGIARVNSKDEVEVVKHTMLPHHMLATGQGQDLFKGLNKLFLGHNRFATQGGISPKNAHPFDFHNLVGAHNGSLLSTYILPVHKGYDVDSEALYASISAKGTEEVAEKINGAFALTWYNKENKTLHFWRNNQRPLWLAYSEDDKVLFWASERGFLDLALPRNNIKYKEPWELPVNKEFIYPVVTNVTEMPTIGVPAVLERKSYTPPSYNNSGWRGRGRWDDKQRRMVYDDDQYDSYDDWYNGAYNRNRYSQETLPAKKQIALVVQNESMNQTNNLLSTVKDVVEGQRVLNSFPDHLLRLRLKMLSDQSLAESLQTLETTGT